MTEFRARLFVALQRLLPKYLLTALVYRIARIRHVATKNFLITRFVALYDVETEEVARPVPEGFESFNDFFTRELEPDARLVDPHEDGIVSPVDGTVSAAGAIDGESVLQAKGHSYTLTDLLATDTAEVERYNGGAFATLYLAPYNYHRIHAPVAGELTALRYVPGDLYSVNAATVRHLPRLFARNERLVCHFESARGPLALVFVGAMNVGTINSIWTGDIRPRSTGVVEEFDLRHLRADRQFARADLLGWFNFGSTVILVAPPGVCDGFPTLKPGTTLCMGERIGQLIAVE
jgi:phosphatidylserine decarboxylase